MFIFNIYYLNTSINVLPQINLLFEPINAVNLTKLKKCYGQLSTNYVNIIYLEDVHENI